MQKSGILAVLPLMAVKYFLVSLTIVLCIGFALDRILIPMLEESGQLGRYGWVEEDDKLQEYMWARNQADPQAPVWRSKAAPVSVIKPKTHRILVMGDSFVWGHGYANLNNIWWRQLAKELERRGYSDVEVIAAGMCGAQTRQELDWAKKLIPQYKPDLVVFGYFVNDPEEISKKTGQPFLALPKFKFDEEDASPLVHSGFASLWPKLSERLAWIHRNMIRNRHFAAGKEYDEPTWELKLLSGENFEQYKNTVKEVAKFAKSSAVPIFFITLPATTSIGEKHESAQELNAYYSSRYAPVQKLFEDAGIKFVNNLNQYIAALKNDKRLGTWLGVNPINRHPSAMVTHFYATSAADYIEAHYPESLGKRKPEQAGGPAQTLWINDWVPPSAALTERSPYEVEISLPHSFDDLLNQPLRKPFIQLNLEKPMAIKEIKISGECLTAADMYLTREDLDKHYDDDSLLELGLERGTHLNWKVSDPRYAASVNTIRICPQMKGVDRRLILEVTPAGSVDPKH